MTKDDIAPPIARAQQQTDRPSLLGKRIFMGAGTVQPGQGGIARVSRLTGLTLLREGADVRIQTLLDPKPESVGQVRALPGYGSKAAFAAGAWSHALWADGYIYDHVGLSRAHPRAMTGKKPLIVWAHGIEVWEGLRPAARQLLESANNRLFNSHFTFNRVRNLHGPITGEVCPLGTEEDDPPAQRADFKGPPTVFLIGRIDEPAGYKGHAELIEAWPSIASAVPEARLVIAGGGPALPVVRSMAAQSPVAAQIEVLGFVPEAEIASLWARAHVFAMPSRKEGFGLVYVEAMRYGVPVVASTHDAGAEVNQHDMTGVNVSMDRPGELAEQVIGLLRDTDRCAAMGEAGFALWSTKYRRSAFEARLAPILSRMLVA